MLAYNPVLELFNYRRFNADIIQARLPKHADGKHPVRNGVIIVTKKKSIQLTDSYPSNADERSRGSVY